MKKALIILLVIVILAGLAGCRGGGDNDSLPTPTKRVVCVQTGSGEPRCFDVPDYPTLAPIQREE